MYDDDLYDNGMYERSTEPAKGWVLYSERALDTLCLCGLRNRLSHGQLEPQRHYHALDGSSIILHRAAVDGILEDITQSDLDVLRAVVTDYVDKYRYDTKRVDEQWPEDEDLLIVITPNRIRSILSLNQYDLPTRQITLALRRIESLAVKGHYWVRKTQAEPYPINGSLFELEIDMSDSGKRVQEYMLYFGTEWGKAFLHNVRCGNFVVVRDIPYQDLDSGAKQLFYIAMVMPRKELSRGRNELLQLMNIKEKQNTPRSIKRLESYMNQLTEMKLIQWQWRQDFRKYVIKRIYNPVKGVMSGAMLSEHEQIPVKASEQEQDEAWEVQFERILNDLAQKNHRSDYESIRYRIYRDAIKMQERAEGMNNSENKASYKQTILRKHWESFSPYYLWTHWEFRQWFRDNPGQARYNSDYVWCEEVFDKIEKDHKLQSNVLGWVEAVEDYVACLT